MILVEIVLQEDEQVPPKGTELDGSGGAGRGQGAAPSPFILYREFLPWEWRLSHCTLLPRVAKD